MNKNTCTTQLRPESNVDRYSHRTSLKLNLSVSQYKQCLRVELAGLCVFIAVVWALLAIPIVIHHTESNEDQNVSIPALRDKLQLEATSNASNNTCPSHCNKDFKSGHSFQDFCTCIPTCRWKDVSDVYSDIVDKIGIFLVCVGMVAWMIVMVTGCIRQNQIFTFPSILIIYQNITWMVLCVTVLTSLVGRHALYCVSDDLIESILYSTKFCTFSGITLYYGMLQLLCWWICHVSVLFFQITFPFKALSLTKSKRVRYKLHAVCILVSLLVPLLPVLVTIGHDAFTYGDGVGNAGFTIIRLPALVCTSTDPDATFYSLVLPTILILDAGLALLILLFWFVHKQTVFINHSNPLKIGTAEKKLLVIFIYVIILGVVTLATFTTFSKNSPRFLRQLFEYFKCELPGPAEPCDRSALEGLNNAVPAVISVVLLALIPLFTLIFTVNVKDLKEFFHRCRMLKSKFGEQNKTVQTSMGISEGNQL